MIIGSTLGRYLSLRFFSMIMGVFLVIVGVIYVFDFIELLRRSNNLYGISPSFIAFLALLRTPSVGEQILPFCVLFGVMAAFLDLSRKLELVVARAAGVSVWQFLLPALCIAAGIGITSVTLFNPISAEMKQRADVIETRLFGTGGDESANQGGFWIRQRSIDGEAILHSPQMPVGGTTLKSVTAYVYEPDGLFEERVEASQAMLLPGVWKFQNAQISSPGQEARQVGIYLLATDLSPDEVVQGSLKPDSVPFWSLQRLRQESDIAGLDSTGFRLQFQTLLARPLLLIAMVLIAAAFSLRFFRFGGIGWMVGSGIAAGFVLYFLTKTVADLGGSGLLNTSVAAWSPAVVGSMLGALALLNQEDG